MPNAVRNLEPKQVWNHFADLNAVPRPSKKEERVIKFIVDFGKRLGLPVQVDAVGNVIIKKPASKGMEKKPDLNATDVEGAVDRAVLALNEPQTGWSAPPRKIMLYATDGVHTARRQRGVGHH